MSPYNFDHILVFESNKTLKLADISNPMDRLSYACKVNTEIRSQHQQQVSVCQQSALCTQPVAVHSASSPTSQSTVPSHQLVMTRVERGTPTTSETDCAAFCTSAPWPSVVPRAMSASVRLGQSGTLCMSNIMDCT